MDKKLKDKLIKQVVADVNGSDYLFQKAQEELEGSIEFRLQEAGVTDDDGEIQASIELVIGAARARRK